MSQSRPPEHAGTPIAIMAVRPQMDRTLEVRSPAVGEDGRIDPLFSATGDNVSPPLSWTAVPEAESYAVVVEDPDAPGDEPYVHWLIWDLPGTVTELAQAVVAAPQPPSPEGAVQGLNGSRTFGWFGPKPPAGHGVHHYHFQVFALSKRLGMGPETGLPQLLNALKGTTLASGELIGTFETPDIPQIREGRHDVAPEGFAGRPGDEPRGAAVDPPRT
ncbi:MAG: YbhB/YbcL family Raf kinase inhibitor-like protein [Pseudomonadota bacterium]|nr:YbhB/YbcL family Raf kinase inhibitor-like protein [Pseudomonadota bacterium]